MERKTLNYRIDPFSVLARLGFSDRQLTGLSILKDKGRLTSGLYQDATGVSRQTAARDLEELVKKGILERKGEKKTTHYIRAVNMPRL